MDDEKRKKFEDARQTSWAGLAVLIHRIPREWRVGSRWAG